MPTERKTPETCRFFTSDTHFFHKNIIKYCNRPFDDVDEMNEMMIKNWNDRVRPGDVVYHLGDFAFTKDVKAYVKLLDRLNGQIHLVKGNHDWIDKEVRPHFASVSDYKELRDGDEMIVLCHYSMRVWNKSNRGSIMLYGHSHGELPGNKQTTDVGVDAWNYAPVSIEEIRKRLATPEDNPIKHHGD